MAKRKFEVGDKALYRDANMTGIIEAFLPGGQGYAGYYRFRPDQPEADFYYLYSRDMDKIVPDPDLVNIW